MDLRQRNLKTFQQHLLVQRALMLLVVLNRLAELFRLTQIQSTSPHRGEGQSLSPKYLSGGEGDSSIPIPLFSKEGAGGVIYTYDKNGNLTKKIEYDDDGNIKTITLYTYDYENRLIRVEMQRDGREKIVEFTYDPFGFVLNDPINFVDPWGLLSEEYTDYTKIDGSLSWRTNNPGNIIAGPWTNEHGAIGKDSGSGKFAKFPSEEAGFQALKDLLNSSQYKDLTVKDAIKKYAPFTVVVVVVSVFVVPPLLPPPPPPHPARRVRKRISVSERKEDFLR